MAVTHATTATGADDPTKEINKAEWNASHTVDNGSFVAAKLSASATDVIFGRSSAGAGNGEEISCTSAGRAIVASASMIAAARTMSVPYILYKSGASVSSPNDTTEDTLATITVPANSMGANGFIWLFGRLVLTNNANVKTARIRFGATALMAEPVTSRAFFHFNMLLFNANATNAQKSWYDGGGTTAGNIVRGSASAAIDTTASNNITITGQKATAGDTFTLDGYTALLMADGA